MVQVLLVDDDPEVLRAYRLVLRKAGFDVDTAADGEQALAKLQPGGFEVIVSDIAMPKLGGLDFLKAVREHDLDIPVILVTGGPALDTAVRAVEYGAFRYLTKPVEPEMLREAVTRAARLNRMAKLKREALELLGREGNWPGDRAALESRLSRALERIWIAFQPIVSWTDRRVYGFEGLVRSEEPTLSRPSDLILAAERLSRVRELSRIIRAQVAAAVAQAPGRALLFTNLHAQDLEDEELYSPSSPLSRVAGRVVLEVTERASLEGIKDVRARVAVLRDAGFRIAVDDLGSGYAGLSSFSILDPDVVKIDMSLVRAVDVDPRKQSVVRSIVRLSQELGMRVIAEGLETVGERDVLAELGCDLMQGFFFGKPGREFLVPALES